MILNSQDYPKWHLPKGAKIRLGKGWVKAIAYSPDCTRLAVASSIGIWIYDAHSYEELALFTGHADSFSSIMYSPDGGTIATGGNQGVCLWDATTGECNPSLIKSTGEVLSIAFSPDGSTIAMVIHDSKDTRYFVAPSYIHIRDACTGKHTTRLAGHAGKIDSFSSIAYSSDGHTLGTGSYKEANLWNAVTGEHITTLTRHAGSVENIFSTGSVESIAFSPDGKTIATSGGILGKEVNLWDATTGQHKTILTKNSNIVTYSPDGKTIATLDYSKVILWDAGTHTHKITLNGHTGIVEDLAFSPNGKTIAIGTHEEVNIWNVDTADHKVTLTGYANSVKNVEFSPDEKTIISGCRHGINSSQREHLWDAVTGKHKTTQDKIVYSTDGAMIATWTCKKEKNQDVRLWDTATGEHKATLTEHADRVSNIVYSPDGKTISIWSEDLEKKDLFLGSFPKKYKVSLWDSITGEHKVTLSEYTKSLESFGYTPDTRTIIRRRKQEVSLWDSTTGEHKVTFMRHSDSGETFVYSPDGSTIATRNYENGKVFLWDTSTGQQKQLTEHTDCGETFIYSPDGSTIATGSYGEVFLWDTSTGERKITLLAHPDYIEEIVYSPDGSTIATRGYGDKEVYLWDASTGEHKATLEELFNISDDVDNITFSPDNKAVVTSCTRSFEGKSYDTEIRLWDAATGEHKNVLTGDNFVFSPDGNTIATWSYEEVHLWDAVTGKHKITLTGHTGNIHNLVYSSDGSTLATGSNDGTVLLWETGSFICQYPNFNPQKIYGNWWAGWALDIHTISSHSLQNGGYDTQRTELGESIYQLKYHNDTSKIQPLAKNVAKFLKEEFKVNGYLILPQIEAILPMPLSANTSFRPVPEIATQIGQILDVPVPLDYLIKVKTTAQHNFESEESRREQLQGAFAVQAKNRKYRCVLLLDDIYNSGVTLTEATDVLQKQGGISQIFVLTLTYTRTKR